MTKGEKKVLVMLLLLLSWGCNVVPDGQNPPDHRPDPPPERLTATASDSEIIEGPSLPPQFFVRAVWPVRPGQDISVTLDSRLTGDMEIRIYSVLTPVIFLGSWHDFASATLPLDMKKALSPPRGEKPYWATDGVSGPALGEFSLKQRLFYPVTGITGEWRRQSMSLPPLPGGLFLIEAQLGPQVACLPLLVSALDAFAFPGEETSLWLIDTGTGQPWADMPCFYTREGDWLPASSDGRGLVRFPVAGNSWLLTHGDAPVYATALSEVRDREDPRGEICPPALKSLAVPDGFAFPQGSVVRAVLWCGSDSEEEVILTGRENDTAIDRQSRLCREGQCEFFFPVAEPGWHQIAAGEARRSFYVYGDRPAESTVPAKYYEDGERAVVHLLVPGRNAAQWATLTTAEDRLLDERYLAPFTGNRLHVLSASLSSGPLRVHTCYAEGGRLFRETWELPPLPGESPFLKWTGTLREGDVASFCPDPPARFRLWVTGDLPLSPVFSRNEILPRTVTAPGDNAPLLYEKWARQNLLADYSRALLAHEQKNYRETVRRCRQILQMNPGADRASRLLVSALKKGDDAAAISAPDTMTRLTQEIVFARSEMSLDEFLSTIAAQTGVYIEIDPDSLTRLAGEKISLPQGEEAISLLNYVLVKCNLAYSIENGVFYIADAGAIGPKALEELDRRVDGQIRLLNQGQEPVPFPSSGQEWQTAPVQLIFPAPGIWCAHLITATATGFVHTWQPVPVRGREEK